MTGVTFDETSQGLGRETSLQSAKGYLQELIFSKEWLDEYLQKHRIEYLKEFVEKFLEEFLEIIIIIIKY